MWIISKTGFVSLVEHDTDPHLIRARARRKEHLTSTFTFLTDTDIIDYGAGASDYRWHANVPRPMAAEAILNGVMSVDYSSHVKEEVSGKDNQMYSAMLKCWNALYELQRPPRTDRDWWTDRWNDDDYAEDDEPFYGGGRPLPGFSRDRFSRHIPDEFLDPFPRRSEPSTDPDDDLGNLTGKLADKMLNPRPAPPKSWSSFGGRSSIDALMRRPTGSKGTPLPLSATAEPDDAAPLEVKEWPKPKAKKLRIDGDDECVVCAGQFEEGDRYVVLPEDEIYGEDEGPAHADCAEDEGFVVQK